MGGMGVWKKAPPELVKTFEEVITTVPGAQPRKANTGRKATGRKGRL
jgi:hypothetical protein